MTRETVPVDFYDKMLSFYYNQVLSVCLLFAWADVTRHNLDSTQVLMSYYRVLPA